MKSAFLDENFVKNLRVLVEGEVEEAEVIMAARGFSKEFQDMIQKVGRLANEQVGPVVDQIRLTYGPEMAESFQDTVRSQMDTVLNALAAAKDTIDNIVIDITDGKLGNMMDTDMDSDEFDQTVDGSDLHSTIDPEIGDEGLGDEDFGDELGDDFEDEFGSEEPLGRSALESKKISLEKQINEMKMKLKNKRKVSESKMKK